MSFVPINGLRLLAIETGVLLAFTVLSFLLFRFWRRELATPHWLNTLLASHRRAVLFVIAVALVGRALLLPWVGVPQPHMNDEFSYLLMGDTFSHFRLTNPTPPAWQHFETFHVNLTPTYHSKYPVAPGLVLAFGEIVFHQPWLGIYLTTAILCGAICWASQPFVPPAWALLGGLLAVFRFALFSYWMNSYWGGSIAALGGAVALGAVVRLFAPGRMEANRALLAILFALSLLTLATSRPYEGLAYSLPLLVYFAYKLFRGVLNREVNLRSTALPVIAIGLAGLALMGFYNQRTTNNPLLMPYALNERTYSELPLFFGQGPIHHVSSHDPVFAKYYIVEAREHNYNPNSPASEIVWLEIVRLWDDWFFYVGPALSFPLLLGLLLCIKRRELRLVLAVTLTTGAAVASCVFSQAHYFSPATAALYVFMDAGLVYLWDERNDAARAFVVAICLTVAATSLTRTSDSSALNAVYNFPDTRTLVAQQLGSQPGKQLVLVSYDFERHYPGDELVHNGAEFSTQKVLWARSKGAQNDSDLCRAYPDRSFWSLTTDDESFTLKPADICPPQSAAHGPNTRAAANN